MTDTTVVPKSNFIARTSIDDSIRSSEKDSETPSHKTTSRVRNFFNKAAKAAKEIVKHPAVKFLAGMAIGAAVGLLIAAAVTGLALSGIGIPLLIMGAGILTVSLLTSAADAASKTLDETDSGSEAAKAALTEVGKGLGWGAAGVAADIGIFIAAAALAIGSPFLLVGMCGGSGSRDYDREVALAREQEQKNEQSIET